MAGILIKNNRVLCAQRKEQKNAYLSRKWEFPGGKIEPNETIFQTVVREFEEELSIKISPIKHIGKVEFKYPDFILKMDIVLVSGSKLDIKNNVHINHSFFSYNELLQLDLVEADLPIIEMIRQYL